MPKISQFVLLACNATTLGPVLSSGPTVIQGASGTRTPAAQGGPGV